MIQPVYIEQDQNSVLPIIQSAPLSTTHQFNLGPRTNIINVGGITVTFNTGENNNIAGYMEGSAKIMAECDPAEPRNITNGADGQRVGYIGTDNSYYTNTGQPGGVSNRTECDANGDGLVTFRNDLVEALRQYQGITLAPGAPEGQPAKINIVINKNTGRVDGVITIGNGNVMGGGLTFFTKGINVEPNSVTANTDMIEDTSASIRHTRGNGVDTQTGVTTLLIELVVDKLGVNFGGPMTRDELEFTISTEDMEVLTNGGYRVVFNGTIEAGVVVIEEPVENLDRLMYIPYVSSGNYALSAESPDRNSVDMSNAQELLDKAFEESQQIGNQ